ncbi:MAG: aminotransferase class V-fold PLP-dependent enzyme [Acidobacteria bacterium]|nr:aminotransferase class V-fold PLP-dependent enzyme [Acidobacteriota bacterium]
MSRRRDFFKTLASIPVVGSLIPASLASAAPAGRNFLKELGVPPIINGAGVYTMFTGSLMLPEVVDAIRQMSTEFVRIDELHDRVGERIAEMLGAESAMVSSGAFGAMQLGTAACITGDDLEKIKRIPDIRGMKNEVVVQKSHWFPYNHAIRNCGVNLIEVETAEQIEAAIHGRTALLLFLNKAEREGKVGMQEFIDIGKKHKVPTMNDIAADVPPVENLTRSLKMGFDLIAVSGGKGMRGPQSSGLLYGRRDLIKAARMNTLPNSDTMGRGLKVTKEEIVAVMVALENYLKRDHKADWAEWERRVKTMSDAVAKVRGVKAEPFLPEIANEVPHVRISWDQSVVKIKPDDVKQRLRDGSPSIEVIPGDGYVPDTLEIASWMLKPGDAAIVGRRIFEELSKAV